MAALHAKRQKLEKVLRAMRACIVACSGGVDSMLLATLAHRALHKNCWIIHAQSPAVPIEATARVISTATEGSWQLDIIKTTEFSDEAYLRNPVNRCFYCKDHLYRSLSSIARRILNGGGGFYREENLQIVSGTNCDDLSEYRPGLAAAEDHGIRHPFVEAGIGKSEIRALSRALALPFSELPASPCLASRLYTGTRVTPERLLAAHFAEEMLKRRLGVDVVRCRIQQDEMRVEVRAQDRSYYTDEVIRDLRRALRVRHPLIVKVSLDPVDYAPGRSFRRAG